MATILRILYEEEGLISSIDLRGFAASKKKVQCGGSGERRGGRIAAED